jgi:hypothetical protein
MRGPESAALPPVAGPAPPDEVLPAVEPPVLASPVLVPPLLTPPVLATIPVPPLLASALLVPPLALPPAPPPPEPPLLVAASRPAEPPVDGDPFSEMRCPLESTQ